MKLLSDRRHELVSLRTQAMCRLHRPLRELIAGGARRQLSAETAFDLLNDLKPNDPANQMRLEIAFDHIEDVMRLGECSSLPMIADRHHKRITNHRFVPRSRPSRSTSGIRSVPRRPIRAWACCPRWSGGGSKFAIRSRPRPASLRRRCHGIS
jgi:hypothetical protein